MPKRSHVLMLVTFVILASLVLFASNPSCGTVNVLVGPTQVCQAAVQPDGSFTCPNITAGGPGSVTVTFNFQSSTCGGIEYTSSTGYATEVVQSNQQSTQTTGTCTPNPTVQGTQYTCSGNVTGQN